MKLIQQLIIFYRKETLRSKTKGFWRTNQARVPQEGQDHQENRITYGMH